MRLALIQMRVVPDKQANLSHARALLEDGYRFVTISELLCTK